VLSRAEFWRGVAGAAAVLPSLATSILDVSPAAAEDGEVVLPSGVSYKVLTAGDGPIPNIGELVGIRFRASCGDNKFDDIFDSPEPYYTRVGAGRPLKVCNAGIISKNTLCLLTPLRPLSCVYVFRALKKLFLK